MEITSKLEAEAALFGSKGSCLWPLNRTSPVGNFRPCRG